MGFNPQKPKPQLVRTFAPLLPLGAFDGAPRHINVANARELELLIRYVRSGDALPTNRLAMRIMNVAEKVDGKSYRRTIESGTLTPSTTTQGFESQVDTGIKVFPFTGIPNGDEVVESYLVRVGPSTLMEFSFAELDAGATASELEVHAALLLVGTG